MYMHLESPAAYESNQQCFKCELDSEAWSTHTGKGADKLSAFTVST